MALSFRFVLVTLGLCAVPGCGQSAAKSCPSDVPVGCVDPSLGYDAGIGEILNARCRPCHAPGGIEQGVLLSDYSHVYRERMSVGSQIVTCTMPPDGAPSLTDSERKQILAWLSCGAPE